MLIGFPTIANKNDPIAFDTIIRRRRTVYKMVCIFLKDYQ